MPLPEDGFKVKLKAKNCNHASVWSTFTLIKYQWIFRFDILWDLIAILIQEHSLIISFSDFAVFPLNLSHSL